MLWGTLFAMTGAVLVATPLGILSAVFCHYYAPRPVARWYRRLIELLAGIPSVVYGFWGLVNLVPLIARLHPPGPSLLAGILILTIMILPTIALMADAALANVPQQLLRGAAALGLPRWATIRGVVFPAAKSGLFTGVILETGRAVGETMAVLMVCGNVVRTPHSLFDPIRTLTANIALEMAFAEGDHRAALFVSGLILMGLIVALAAAAEVIGKERVYG
jgi:phosphate transport system permease protein